MPPVDPSTAAGTESSPSQPDQGIGSSSGAATPAIEMEEDGSPAVKREERSATVDANFPSGFLGRSSAVDNLRHASREKTNEKRAELITSGSPEQQVAVKRFFALMLPTLMDVYSASVGISVRTKAMLGMTKIMYYAPKDELSSIVSVSTGSLQK